MIEKKTEGFIYGVQNKIPDEKVESAAATDSNNWVTVDGNIELARGRETVGNFGDIGCNCGQIFAPKVDGTKIHFQKIKNKIQYFDGSTWQDIITGLTDNAQYTFASYISLAGAYVFAGGVDGLYKIAVANPGDYKDMFNSSKNHKGFILINDQRMFLWNRFDGTPDKNALYLSKIDPQDGNYTTVSNESIGTGDGVTTNFTGTLTEATGKRFVFGLSLDTNPASVTAVDDYLGNISGTGVSGTINYATGAYDITFDTAPAAAADIRVSYQYEDSNSGGITDFTFSSPRTAGEGDILPQEFLGEAIQNVEVFEGRYYSFKKTVAYELDLTIDDTNATNVVYRRDIGIPYFRAMVATGKGIVFMNTANPDKPILSILERNPVGNTLEPVNLTPLFDWSRYEFDECVIDTYGESIVVSAKSKGADENDTMFVVNTTQRYSVDILSYGVATFAKDQGILYAGDPSTDTMYKILSGFDDLSELIDNYWEGKDENFDADRLKRVRYLQIKGLIDKDQSFEVYASYDNDDFTLLGTVVGTGSYVDIGSPQTIGSNGIGSEVVGGGDIESAYPYLVQLRIRTPKFRTRKIRLIAKDIGYVSVEWIKDLDILTFEQKLPRKYRQKQHVSSDGLTTGLPTFDL